jgi:hypothetical protein
MRCEAVSQVSVKVAQLHGRPYPQTFFCCRRPAGGSRSAPAGERPVCQSHQKAKRVVWIEDLAADLVRR